MNILIVDETTEAQAAVGALINKIDASDRDVLDVRVQLAGPSSYKERIKASDVLILGPALGSDATGLARSAKLAAPDIEIIMIVSSTLYGGGAFRAAHGAKVRKILPQSANELDILQELVGIHEEFRLKGKACDGNLIVFTQAKGGVGVTNICAALGEICNLSGKKTIIWDLDTETKDLSRALTAYGPQAEVMTGWVSGEKDITRETFSSALVPVGKNVSLLPPPHLLAAAMDLGGHPDMVEIVGRIIHLARVTHDNVIVDTSGRLSPATGALVRMSEKTVVVLDDSVLGLSAARPYIANLRSLLPHMDSLAFLCSGVKLSPREIAEYLDEGASFQSGSWNMPVVPFDAAAEKWPGSGKTLYSMGAKNTQNALVEIASMLSLIDSESNADRSSSRKSSRATEESESGFARQFVQRVFNPLRPQKSY